MASGEVSGGDGAAPGGGASSRGLSGGKGKVNGRRGDDVVFFFLAKGYVCNQCQRWVILSQLHDDVHNRCFWSTL